MPKEEKIDSVYQLPFDQYQRYRLLAEVVPVLEGEDSPLSMLEVGGFPPRLTRFLPDRSITIADRLEGACQGYVRAEGLQLPFADNSFGAVISLDTLEHVPPHLRTDFILELCRVAESCVIVAAPFASDAVKAADRAAYEFILAHAGYEQEFLKEHLEAELPDMVSTTVCMVEQGLDVQVIPSGRLDRWMLMMAAYYTLDSDPELAPVVPFFMEAYNRAFYEFDKAEPAYRHFLIGSYEGLGERWGKLAGLATGETVEVADTRGVSLVIELARTMALKAKDRERESLVAQLVEKDEEIKALREQVTALQDFMDKVKSTPLYNLYEKVIKRRS